MNGKGLKTIAAKSFLAFLLAMVFIALLAQVLFRPH
jgi:uncharacterized membrane protein